MKISQIILEVSKGERAKKRREELAARRAASAAEQSESDKAKKMAAELKAKLRQQKISQQLKPIEVPKKEEPTGFLANPELAKYADDEDESGVYLMFTVRKDAASKENVLWAYWNKTGVENIETVEPYNQILRLGKSPLTNQLFSKIRELIGIYGYVHVYINYNMMKLMPYEFKNLAEYLKQKYPEDTGNVGVEVDTKPRSENYGTTYNPTSRTQQKFSAEYVKKFDADLVRLFRTNPELSQAFRRVSTANQNEIRNQLLQVIATYSPDVEDAIPEIKSILNI
jgi:hypothetical protein